LYSRYPTGIPAIQQASPLSSTGNGGLLLSGWLNNKFFFIILFKNKKQIGKLWQDTGNKKKE
jgi:hypothetical protein